jgi:uncharacterized membrane protein
MQRKCDGFSSYAEDVEASKAQSTDEIVNAIPESGQNDEHGGEPIHSHGHGHGHGHGPAPKGSRRVRRILTFITLPLIVLNVIALIVLWPKHGSEAGPLSSPAGVPPLVAATVTDVELINCNSEFELDAGATKCVVTTARLEGKANRGKATKFEGSLITSARLRPHDKIYLTELSGQGSEKKYGFYEFRREKPVLILLAGFVITALIIGRRSGLRALLALGLSLVLLVKFMLPAIIEGRNPLLVALVGSAAVMFLALYLSHGINVRTTSAVLGTLVSLGITGGLAAIATKAARFTGLSGEETSYLRATAEQIDLRGLLLAGIIIGALGVLDDVTVTQASAVWELHQANPEMGFRGRFDAALRIGRDHIASVVNTLILAYAGASLPLLLLVTQAGTSLAEAFNGEPVATELVRMLAGSIGLMTAVPITTALTAFVVGLDEPTSTVDQSPPELITDSPPRLSRREREFWASAR